MDDSAHNFNPDAVINNEECETCFDGILNGDEISIDCGGQLCEPCTQGCIDDSAHNFNPDAVINNEECETCFDGIKNGDEVRVDCGGQLCEPCTQGCMDESAHNFNPDAVINNEECETCFDGIKNGDEVRVDCGGELCEPCTQGCMDDSAHNFNPDAVINNEECETCFDGILNGDEISIDCGGELCEPCTQGCMDESAHNFNPDAVINNEECETCFDGIKNGDEVRVDCGGGLCEPCQNDLNCDNPSNMALDGIAKSSSNLVFPNIDFSAQNATDGITSSNWRDGSLMITKYEDNPWWELDLGSMNYVEHLMLYNWKNHPEFLEDIYIFYSEHPFESGEMKDMMNDEDVKSVFVSKMALWPHQVDVEQNIRFIRVQMDHPGYLSMAEFEAIGCSYATEEVIYGCTYKDSHNFNPEATEDLRYLRQFII